MPGSRHLLQAAERKLGRAERLRQLQQGPAADSQAAGDAQQLQQVGNAPPIMRWVAVVQEEHNAYMTAPLSSLERVHQPSDARICRSQPALGRSVF